MNINKFGAFISYLSCLGNNKHFDTYEVEAIANYVKELMPEAPKPGAASCEAIDDLLRQMLIKDKISAIRAYRALTNAGLKEAKDAVEKYWHGGNNNVQT